MRKPIGFTLVALTCLAGPVWADMLRQPPALAPGMARLPRLTAEDPAARKINADLERTDRDIKDYALPCSAEPGSWWYRQTKVAFAGPRFLSLETFNDHYCVGAAHPETFLETPTYDLATGEQVNWRLLLPADLLAPQPRRFDLSVIKGSQQMVALYLGAVPNLPEDCREVILSDVQYFRLWLSQKDGGLLVVPDDLSHAGRACGDPAVFDPSMLVRAGGAPVLTDALANLDP